MPTVTVITPTYNRENTLWKLYTSLIHQSCQDFEWLVIDDGSTDNTGQIIEEMIKQNNIPIKYIYKQNGGKHSALNKGIPLIKSKMTIIVDSDDQLLPVAIETIIKFGEKYYRNKSISALSFLRIFSNGKPVRSLEQSEYEESYIEYLIKQKHPGDMAEVFFTHVLKEFPFPEFTGERFLSEDVVWIEMGKRYKYIFVNKPIYQCEYLSDGLTANDKPLKFASPLGSMLRGKKLMSLECGLKANIKGAIIYNCYKINTAENIPEVLKLTGREKILTFFTRPLGRMYNIKWRK